MIKWLFKTFPHITFFCCFSYFAMFFVIFSILDLEILKFVLHIYERLDYLTFFNQKNYKASVSELFKIYWLLAWPIHETNVHWYSGLIRWHWHLCQSLLDGFYLIWCTVKDARWIEKVPAMTFSSALWTFLKIKFVEQYWEFCNTW